VQFLIFLLFIPLFWYLILRPQQQQRRTHQSVVSGLAVGDKVMTVGGLIGTLTSVDDEVVRLDTGDGHELTFGRTFVRSLVPDPVIDLVADDHDHDLPAPDEPCAKRPVADTTDGVAS
jgi:preprotein translocase subunit YajC